MNLKINSKMLKFKKTPTPHKPKEKKTTEELKKLI